MAGMKQWRRGLAAGLGVPMLLGCVAREPVRPPRRDRPLVTTERSRAQETSGLSARDHGHRQDQIPWMSSYHALRPYLDKNHRLDLVGIVEPLEVSNGRRRRGRIYVVALDDCTDAVLSYDGLPEGWGRWEGKRVCVHTRVRSYGSRQAQSLMMPHVVDISEPTAPEACGAQTPPAGRHVSLRGAASDSKCCLAVMVEGKGRVLLPDVLGGAGAWPSTLFGRRLVVRGVLAREKMWPDPQVGPAGEVSQGAVGQQWVLRRACVRPSP